MQAKFLHFYPGYSWESMNRPRALPFAVFISLYRMITPVAADIALEVQVPAIASVMTGKVGILTDHISSVYELQPEHKNVEAKEKDQANGYRALHAIKNAPKKEIKLTKKV